MRVLMFCLMVLQFVVALPRESDREGGCRVILPAADVHGVYQLWLEGEERRQLIHNNLTPEENGILEVAGLPQPGPGECYRFRMIGTGGGSTLDPTPQNAEIRPY